MANAIPCDAPECEQPSDFLVGNLNTGDQLAFCGLHYVDFCSQFAAAASEPEAADPEPKSDALPERESPETEDPDEAPAHPGPDD